MTDSGQYKSLVLWSQSISGECDLALEKRLIGFGMIQCSQTDEIERRGAVVSGRLEPTILQNDIYIIYTYIYIRRTHIRSSNMRDTQTVKQELHRLTGIVGKEGRTWPVSLSQQTDQTLALLDLLLHFIAGRGDLGLRGEHGADEGEDGAAQRRVERPAHGAQAQLIGRRVWTAVQLDLIRTPTSGIQHQTQNQEQTCRQTDRDRQSDR